MIKVNLCSSEGDMGILANHVPSLIQLVLVLLEIFTDGPASQSGVKSMLISFLVDSLQSIRILQMQIAAFEAGNYRQN